MYQKEFRFSVRVTSDTKRFLEGGLCTEEKEIWHWVVL